jgi:two-component system, cell cycle response regulator DivK
MQPRTILLVDDDADARYVYGVMLRHSGYEVVEAADGAEGLRLAQEREPDLIVMDLALPGMDGWDATSAIRRDAAVGRTPVLALTVHTRGAHRIRAKAAGCDAFLEKPCTPRDLVHAIERHLSIASDDATGDVHART